MDSYAPATSGRAWPRSRSRSRSAPFRPRSRSPPVPVVGRGRDRDLFDDRFDNRFDDRRAACAFRSRSRSPQPLLPPPLGPPLRRNVHNEDSWRRRSPSPRNSSGPSRRSSPRVHPDRLSSMPRSPAYSSRHDNEVDMADNYHDLVASAVPAPAPPSGPSRNGAYDRSSDRAPPSGPSRSYAAPPSQAGPPPTGPAISAHGGPPPGRPRGGSGYAAPPAPRGRSSLVYRAPSYSADTAPPAGPRGAGYGRGSSDYAASATTSPATTSGSAYRADFHASPRGGGPAGSPAFPFRGSGNSTSRTYPMTQRFNTSTTTALGNVTAGPPTGPPAASKSSSSYHLPVPTGPSAAAGATGAASAVAASSSSHLSSVGHHLSSLPKPLPDGQLLPSGLTPEQEQKLKHLEAEAERMRAELREKQSRVRESLAEWDVRQRESAREALRSDLAEDNLRSIEADGDDAMDVAAF
ncbi:hypothetical protein DV736_g6085, partial [Chaetothyriales sp. CBS 134916]